MRLLILGGYGNFGARIARALAREPGIELLIAGRDRARADGLAQEIGATSMRIDALGPGLTEALRRARADAVIHTVGPFQGQGWDVALAAAEARAHYIDLADGRRFVCDFAAALDSPFRAVGRTAITGASTLPGLSTAVIDSMRTRFSTIETVDLCIAPAQQAARGVATLRAVLGYCGEPFRVRQDGRDIEVRGWSGLQRVRFARVPMRLAAWCDVPDLELLPTCDSELHSVSFRAALEVELTQRALAALAFMRARRWIPPVSGLAGLLDRLAGPLDRLGSGTGGMVVRLAGRDRAHRPLRLAWHVTAPDRHGPEIPCMAAIALARRLAAGEAMPPGARPCAGLVSLAEFEHQFERFGMTIDLVVEEGAIDGS